MEKRKLLTKPWVVGLLAMLCCLLWGSAFPCIKIGYELFGIESDHTASQLLFAGARFTLAGILVVLISSLAQRKPLVPKKTSWGMIGKVSIFQTILQYVFFYVGLAHTTGVKASIIEGSHVFFAILLASVFFHQEKLTVAKGIGCIVGFVGVIIINLTGSGLEGGIAFNGEGFMILSCLAYAMSSVLIKDYSQRENPVTLSGYQFIIGGIVMAAVGAIAGGSLQVVSAWSLVMMLYLALISAVAYSVWGIILKYNPISMITVYGFMTPVFGVVLSAIFLDEGGTLPWVQCTAALVLVCAGIYIVNRVPKEKI